MNYMITESVTQIANLFEQLSEEPKILSSLLDEEAQEDVEG